MNITKFFWATLPLLGLSLAHANVSPEQRTAFQTAYSAAQQGKFDEVNAQSGMLKNYPLFPWLEFEYLKQNLATVSDESIIAFTSRNPNSVMSDELYEQWADRVASAGNWNTLLDTLPAEHPNESIQCYRALALGKLGRMPESIKLGTKLINANQGGMNSPCVEVLGVLEDAQVISPADLWQRIAEAMEENQVSFAQAVSRLLPVDKQIIVERWATVRRDPKAEINKLLNEPDLPENRDMIAYGLQRMTEKDWESAYNLWQLAQVKLPFTPNQSGKVESELGAWEAYRQKPSALIRLRNIPNEYRTKRGNIWMVRIALREESWADVLSAVASMDTVTASDPAWRYWKARALQATGQLDQATSILNELAQDATFYGFLAADQLGQHYARLKEPVPDRTQRITGINKLAAYTRWQEWLALGERDKARKEWFRLVKAMDKNGVQAAAEIANRMGDPNLAIWTISKTKDWNAVDLRFPVHYEDLVLNSSQQEGISPAWILGVMRRESAFDQTATSSVNALGLMQLMPATARHVGKKLGVTISANADILQPATNVQLGSAYLKQMLKQFDGDYARATAAYNAGPGRIPKWKPTRSIAADQWIESIPFDETRNYVQAVMAYTTVYDAKLHPDRSLSLSSRLKPISVE